MAYLFCTQTCFDGSRLFREGEVCMKAKNPDKRCFDSIKKEDYYGALKTRSAATRHIFRAGPDGGEADEFTQANARAREAAGTNPNAASLALTGAAKTTIEAGKQQ